MSYDLRVWGRKMSEVGDLLSAARGWVGRDGLWVLQGRSWQIAVCAPQAVEPEDVPPGAAELLPGLSLLVELSLEPISAPKAALSALTSVARSLAVELAGVIEDPQEGTLSLPRGAKRYEKPKPEERFTVLDLSWWYAPSPLRLDDGPRTLLAILAKHLPESVPRRYGLWEPPQYKTDETGVAGLESFIAQNLDNSPVFYTTRPVVGFSIADCNATAHPRLGVRANRLNIEAEASVLDQPGWERALRRVWRDVSSFLRPFYGEARLLSNFMWRGATTYSDMKTEIHPVRSWFWRGIPPKLGLACVLGPPYSRLWQPPGAEPVGDLRFLESASWRDRRSLGLTVPPDLAQRWMPAWGEQPGGGYAVNWCDQLPVTWPFEPQVAT